MGEIARQGSTYTEDIKKEAAILYAIKGTNSAVSRALDIPEQTISGWKKTDWWESLVGEARSQNADQHIAQYTALVSDAIAYAHANLDKASPKDALIMAATATDKARLLLNQPTSISSSSKGIDDLRRQFEALAANHKRIEDTVVATVDKSVDNQD